MGKELAIVLIILFFVGHLIINGTMLYMMAKGDGFALSPSSIKDLNQFTWFGAIITFIISLILFTWVYLFSLLHLAFHGKLPEGFD